MGARVRAKPLLSRGARAGARPCALKSGRRRTDQPTDCGAACAPVLAWQGGKPTRPGYDLVIPPRTPPQEVLSTTGSAHPYSCAYSRIGPSRAAPRAVTLAPRNGSFFYFRGKIILDNPVYSQGVRQHVYRLHHEREGYVISDKSSKNFYKEMMDARFCFAPTGARPVERARAGAHTGLAHRLTDARRPRPPLRQAGAGDSASSRPSSPAASP